MSELNLRDYFAAKFAHAELMTCGVSGPACDALIEAIGQTGESPENYMARSAYDLADAMIRARENITGATKMTDQTDRELLELAAKAAGIKGSLIGSAAPSVLYESDGVAIYWDPLTRSADALDLAVKLQMVISVTPHNSFAGSRLGYAASNDRDPYAATRRAIVRAAAAIAQNGTES